MPIHNTLISNGMGIFFDDPKPRVTPLEWKKIRGNLYSAHNFTTKELEEVEGIFFGVMNEEREKDKGIDSQELVKGMQYMRGHINIHHVSINKINALELEMMKYI